jgi:hypothetical protein
MNNTDSEKVDRDMLREQWRKASQKYYEKNKEIVRAKKLAYYHKNKQELENENNTLEKLPE